LVTNNLTTKKKAIMKIHGVSEEEATQMLEEITEENRMALPENVDFFGLEGNQQKNNDPGAE
ncbi:portal protein, partial [Bacillus wiedmannii]